MMKATVTPVTISEAMMQPILLLNDESEATKRTRTVVVGVGLSELLKAPGNSL
jgi:hypothetical protein